MSRTALVTGGSNGIGRASVKMLAKEGIDTVFTYYSDEDAKNSLISEIEAINGAGKVYAIKGDMGDMNDVKRIFESSMEKLGHIDILFNNAGVFLESKFLDAPMENLERTIDVIVKGTFLLTQYVAKQMVDKNIKGRIINTSSAVTKDQAGQPVDYCVAKAGINVFTTALAVELGIHEITVNAILPGSIPTKINSWQFADPKIRESFREGSVLKQFGDPDYIAGALKYFISDEARWTTGVLMSVDGGYTL